MRNIEKQIDEALKASRQSKGRYDLTTAEITELMQDMPKGSIGQAFELMRRTYYLGFSSGMHYQKRQQQN